MLETPKTDHMTNECTKTKKKDMKLDDLREYNRISKQKQLQKESKEQADKRKEKAKLSTGKKRQEETKEQADERRRRSKVTMEKGRIEETNEQKDERRAKERSAKEIKRLKETKEEANARKLREKLAKERARLLAKSCPKSMYDARNAQKVLYGDQIVLPLGETDEKLGSMIHICPFCFALKFKNETSTLCCTNGKVSLTPFPSPPAYLQTLWTADTAEARLFREHARSFNNSLALSSVVVKERKFESDYTPSVVFEGKVCQMYGPLEAEENEVPRFAQLYVVDPATQHTMRIKNMNLPTSLNVKQTALILSVMKKLQELMADVNPFVKDFKHICEIPVEEIKEGKLVIICKDKPKEAHERTYNLQQCFSEVSVLTNSEPGDVVLRKRGGGLQFVYDIHPSAQALHFTLLFPF